MRAIRTLFQMYRVRGVSRVVPGVLATLLMGAHVITRATSAVDEFRTAVHPRFDLTTPHGGPFPSDRFTVHDPEQNTSRRINLPLPIDCAGYRSECEDVTDLNQLDGFHLHPRLSIPFDGAIDPSTATSDTIFVVSLGDALASSNPPAGAVLPGRPRGRIVGINRVVWDPETETLYATADEPLDEHARYALIVTRGVRDAAGFPIEPSVEFQRYRSNHVDGDDEIRGYRRALLTAEWAAHQAGVQPWQIAALSVFTTQSATYLLEKIRDQVFATPPTPANFSLGPYGSRAVYAFGDIASIVFNQQLTTGPTLTPSVGPNLLPLRVVPGAVGRVAFGRFEAADYMVHPGEYVPAIATRTGAPVVQSVNTLYFNVILPSGPMPPNGWPVTIVGHGRPQHKNFLVDSGTSIVSARGVAQIQINAVGHGFGPLGTLTINRTDGTSVTLPAGGRGIDQNGDGVIAGAEGQDSIDPHAPRGAAGGIIQTVADLMQLVRLIEGGIDVDGDGYRDLDPSQIT
jgi:hypothetical protein